MDSSFGTKTKKDNNFNEKIKEIQKKIAVEPKNIFLNKDYCRQLLKMTNHTNVSVALDSIEKFLEFKPNNLEANVLKARALRLLQRNDDALSLLEVMKDKEKDDQPEIEEEIGRNWIFQNKVPNAKKVLKDAYKKFSNNTRIGRALVLCYEQTGEMESALHLTNLLLDKNQEDTRSINGKIWQLQQLDRWDEAIDTGKEFMKKFPEKFFEYGFAQGGIYATGTFLSYARACYLYAIKIDGKNKHNQILLKNKEKIITTINISNEAKVHFKKCLQICDEFIYRVTEGNQNINEKNLILVNELRVKCYSKIREFDKVVSLCNEILIHKKTIPVTYEKGFALMHLQRYKEALAVFDNLLKDYPQMENADINRLISIKKIYPKSKFDEEFQKFKKKWGKKVEKQEENAKTLEIKDNAKLEGIHDKHSNVHINNLEVKLRVFIFSIYENKEHLIKKNFDEIYQNIKKQEKKDSKLIYEFPKENPLIFTTLGALLPMLENGNTAKRLEGQEFHNKIEDFKFHLTIVLKYRNILDHSKGLELETGDLPDYDKGLLVGATNSCIKFLNKYPKIIINKGNTD